MTEESRGDTAAAASEAPKVDMGAAATSAAVIGSRVSSSLLAGLAPLNQIGARLGAQFDALAGTITTSLRRVDAAIRFPATKRAIDEIQGALRSKIAAASATATKDLTTVQKAVLALGPAADKAASGFRTFTNVATIFNTLTNRSDVARKSLSQLSGMRFDRPVAQAGVFAGSVRAIAPAANLASASVKGLGLQIGLAFGLVGITYRFATALKSLFVGGVKDAIALGETVSKTTEVFGPQTAAITSQADAMAKAYGLAKGPLLDASASIGLIAKGAGVATPRAAEMSRSLTMLAADASSFYNVPLDAALEKIRSGLVGESEPLRAFGVLLNEDAVKAEAAALAHGTVAKKLDESSKVAARYSLILKGLKTASGDLARTQDSLANQGRKLAGSIRNTATTVGQLLGPALGAGASILSGAASAVDRFVERNRASISAFAAYVASGFANAAEAVREFPAALGVLTQDVQRVVSEVGQRLGAGEAFARFAAAARVAVAQVGVVLRNLPQYAAVARLGIKEQIDSIPEYFRYVKAIVAETGTFIASRFTYASRVIGAEVGYWIEHVRYFKDASVAIASYVGKSMGDAWNSAMGLIAASTSATVAIVQTLFTGGALLIVGIPAMIVKAFSAAGIDLIAPILAGFTAIDKAGRGVFSGLVDFVGSVFASIGGAIGAVFAKVFGAIGGALGAIGAKIKADLAEITRDVRAIGPRADAGAAPRAFNLPAPPKLADYSADIKKILDGIAAEEAKRNAAIPPVGPAVPRGVIAPEVNPSATTTEDRKQGTAAVQLGSAEAGSAIAKFRNQGGGDDAAKTTAKNSKTQVDLQTQIAASLKYLQNAQQSNNGVQLAIAKL